MSGVEGAQLTWIGINPITTPGGKEPFMHMVFVEGVLNQVGDAIETITKKSPQINLEGQEFTDFYLANKAVIDDLVRAVYIAVASKTGKTGAIIES